MQASVPIPVANIIISFNPQLMKEFHNFNSLKTFKEKAAEFNKLHGDEEKIVRANFLAAQAAAEARGEDPNTVPVPSQYGRNPTGFFDNSVNSTILSLEHTYNDTDQSIITVEFVDPQESFEAMAFLTNPASVPTQYTLPDDPVAMRLQILRAKLEVAQGLLRGTLPFTEIHRAELANLGIGDPLSKTAVAELSDVIESIKKDIAGLGGHIPGWSEADLELQEIINKRIIQLFNEKPGSVIQQPVYIAYGIGDNIKRDWCTPQCFGNLWKANYSFDGTGARVLKLSFGGTAGVGSVLTELGISPLGHGVIKGAEGIITVGLSDRLYSTNSIEILEERLKKMLDVMKSKGAEPDLKILPFVSQVGGGMDNAITEAVTLKVSAPPALAEPTPIDNIWQPSIHIALTQAMTQFIAAAVPIKYKNNVVVLFPNLDIALKETLERDVAIMGRYTPTIIPGRRGTHTTEPGLFYGSHRMNALKELVESLGLQLIHKAATSNRGTGTSQITRLSWPQALGGGFHAGGVSQEAPPLASIGVNTATQLNSISEKDLLEEQHPGHDDHLKHAPGWWEAHSVHVACQSNYQVPFLDKLKSVGEALNKTIAGDASEKNYFPINMGIYIESDQAVLNTMHENNLIADPHTPAIIWADSDMKNSFLDGRVMEADYPFSEETLERFKQLNWDPTTFPTESISKTLHKLHLYDMLRGVSRDYMKKITELLLPVPYMGTFGYTGDIENFLSENDVINDNEDDHNYSKEFGKIVHDRMPVFAYGFRNSNILSVKMDLDGIYTGLLHMNHGQVQQNKQYVQRILLPLTQLVKEQLFRDIKFWKIKSDEMDGKVPEQFKEYIRPFIETTMFGSIASFTKDWEEMGLASTFVRATIDLTADTVFGDWFDDEETYMEIMWEGFLKLYDTFGNDPMPKSVLTVKGNNPTAGAIRASSQSLSKMAAQQIVGKITTIPMFALSTPRMVISRPCRLLAREPRFSQVAGRRFPGGDRATWTSGYYILFGFKHVIQTNTVQSEFSITRSTLMGSTITNKPREKAK